MHRVKTLSYLCRYVDMMPRFGRAVPQLSMISNCIAAIIFDDYSHQVKVAVEWVFGDITNYFAFLDFKKILK